MLNWNWSYTLSTSVAALAIVSGLTSQDIQAQGIQAQSVQAQATSANSLSLDSRAKVSTDAARNSQNASANTPVNAPASTPIKIGETRSQSLTRTQNDAIARIHAHQVNGKNAATVYVRGIPVVTYIESENTSSDSANNAATSQPKESQKSEVKSREKSSLDGQTTKIASNDGKKNSSAVKLPSNNSDSSDNSEESVSESLQERIDSFDYLLTSPNPVERATAAAALINQLKRDGIDASTIIPAWKNGDYVIKFGDRAMLKFDKQALFSDSLQNQTQDVLESANLLRRLLGGAAPVAEVLNAPKPQLAARAIFSPSINSRVVGVMSGMASWYGPGFDGNYSASGEVFNARELTAAHPSLPFGTMVRVVNMDNGQSVVVRINDRGPYAHGRVIDISEAAAGVIGLISSGVAPVKIEVLAK